MKFSDFFHCTYTKSDDWFDPILSIDTPLFIDPFLIYKQQEGIFKDSHKEIIAFFNTQFKLLASSKGNANSIPYKKAFYSMFFPEVEEICLGYTSKGTNGLGSSSGIGNVIVSAMLEAIGAGVSEISHFEEITLLREGFGADRISDMTAGILKHRLIRYTEAICKRKNIPLIEHDFRLGKYNYTCYRWEPLKANLPFNKWNSKPILLVPKNYLRDLPTMNAVSFWDYCYINENDLLRTEFSDDISKNVDKPTIIDFARGHSAIRNNYQLYLEDQPIDPYNIEEDKHGLSKWYDSTKDYVEAHPLSLTSQAAFHKALSTMIREFKHFIEENQGWKLLWNDGGKSKCEKAAQLLFLGIVKHYCHANNIDISPEANIGRGPVDFKFSNGYLYRSLVELKLAHNSKFWNGLNNQLPTYLNAESIDNGYFVVILFTDNDIKKTKDIHDIVSNFSKKIKRSINEVVVNALPDKLSASKLH